MKRNLKLSPYITESWINLVIDVLFQWINEDSLLPPNVDGKVAALEYAEKSCYYYLLHAPKLKLFSDCSDGGASFITLTQFVEI